MKILSDGHFHSGENLGAQLGISRTAVWKHVQGLSDLGLTVHSVKGRGYRLAQQLELLQHQGIINHLNRESRALLSGLDLHFEIDSTNSDLMRRAPSGLESGHVCLAEIQHQGRGRRGRHWVSPFGSNIYLSLLWRFDDGSARLSGLSLAIAVAVARVLESLGVSELAVKWPNDLLHQGRKLAGILLEVAGEADGPCHVVIGLGLNLSMPQSAGGEIDQPWGDLVSAGLKVGRNQLAGSLINELLQSMQQFQNLGLDPMKQDWQRLDATRDRSISLHFINSVISGIGRGIDEQGMLLLERNGEISRYASGEVSLRFQN